MAINLMASNLRLKLQALRARIPVSQFLIYKFMGYFFRAINNFRDEIQ